MMKHLLFLIFISGWVFVPVKPVHFYEGCGEKKGTEVWKANHYEWKLEKLNSESIESIKFIRGFAYIVLRSENFSYTSTENDPESVKKCEKNKTLSHCSGVKPDTSYHIYYLLTNNVMKDIEILLTTESVAQLFKHLQERTRKPVTVTKEVHGSESDEFLKLFPHILEERKENGEKKKFVKNIYKVTAGENIMQIPSIMIKKYEYFDAYVIDADTKLIGISTKDPDLQLFTKNFINFITEHKGKMVETRIVTTFHDLVDIDLSEILKDKSEMTEEFYVLLEYYKHYNFIQSYRSIDTRESGDLDSRLFEKNRRYILLNHKMKTVLLYLTSKLNVNEVTSLLQKGELLLKMNLNYELVIVQPHRTYVPFIIAFKDLVKHILNNTGNMKELNEFFKEN